MRSPEERRTEWEMEVQLWKRRSGVWRQEIWSPRSFGRHAKHSVKSITSFFTGSNSSSATSTTSTEPQPLTSQCNSCLQNTCVRSSTPASPPRRCHTTPSRSSHFWRAICTRSSRRRDTRVYTPSSHCMWTMGRTVCCFAGMGMGWWVGRLRAFWSL